MGYSKTLRRGVFAANFVLNRGAALAVVGGGHAHHVGSRQRGQRGAASDRPVERGHADKIALTVIPDNQMVTKLATGVQANEVPDLISFDLIYMPDFMRAGFLVDITDQMKADPNAAKVAKAFTDLATYKGKHLRHRLHARRLDAGLQQGPLQEGRARSEQAADVAAADP